ncbi:carboxylesterase [Loa loa]|uniref:Carboxylesterase n=1 Tax=Loa loa TaxID=7209 RepID=A0A1S0U5N5_LOALO|nr:carboxylesterase [Loa loa]EFO25645.2 carboxylesterase [Loa loa]
MDGLRALFWVGTVGCFVVDKKSGEPARSINSWDEKDTWYSGRPSTQLQKNDILVRLSIGDLVGQKVTVNNVPWTSDHDPMEQIRKDWLYFEPNPVSPLNNVTVITFLGIPYAEPPISQRRFKPPQLLAKLPGKQPYLAVQHPPSCAQNVEAGPTLFINDPYPFHISEDCLYLNIFTPDTSQDGRPVIVFFMEDQRTALQFVQDHIASFGGDPRQVTIVGHDAGAVSVGLHMLSPFSKNLFRAGAAMSGAEISYHSTIGKSILAFNNTVKLGRYLGCTQPLAKHVWDCILTRSTNDIIQALQAIPVEYNRYLFLPHVDGRFIPAHPMFLLNSFSSGITDYPSAVPYLTGFNREDGSEVVLENRLLGEFNDFVLVDHEYLKNYVLEYAFRHNYTTNREAVAEAIIDRYTYWPDASDEHAVRREFIRMATDAYYVAPISLSAHLHSAAGSPVFMYVNNYEFGQGSNQRFFPDWMAVCHDCDLYLLFGFPFMSKDLLPKYFRNMSWTDADRNASQLLTSIFRQFATFMNPNIPTDSSWLAFEPRRHWYLNFNYSLHSDFTKPGILERDYRWESVSFWNVYIPSLVQYMTTTFPSLEVKIRRELINYQMALGVTVCILFVILVLMCLFAYLLFERNPKQIAKELNRRRFIRNVNDHFSRQWSQESCL